MRAAAVIRNLVVATAVAGTVLVTAGAATADSVAPASASAAPCPSGMVCLYADPQFTGPQVTIQSGSSVPTFPLTFDNQMSAWANNTTVVYCWWTGPNFTGQQFPMPPGTEMSLPPEQDNQASSVGPC